jgi:hypothetical protein
MHKNEEPLHEFRSSLEDIQARIERIQTVDILAIRNKETRKEALRDAERKLAKLRRDLNIEILKSYVVAALLPPIGAVAKLRRWMRRRRPTAASPNEGDPKR